LQRPLPCSLFSVRWRRCHEFGRRDEKSWQKVSVKDLKSMNETVYDYIIVGAGSAGCVLAARLSEDPNNSVLLLEAGRDDRSSLVSMPMGIGRLLAKEECNWYFKTESEAGNANRPAVWVRGRMLGGSSSVNGMIYCRGQAQDYDDWAASGLTEWSWANMAPCFRQIENYSLGEGVLRGVGGPMDISIQTYRSPLTEAVLRAGEAAGLPTREDVNDAPTPEGLGYTPVTIHQGRRVSASTAFLRPVSHRSNLTIITEVEVTRVLFKGQCAVGVSGLNKQSPVSFRCSRTVILACGALQSPKLLQLSGVGPGDHLRKLGIEVVHDLRGVGRNLREHKTIVIEQRLKSHAYSHNRELRGLRLYLNGLRYGLTHSGVLASTYDINGFVRTQSDLDRPDAQMTFWSITIDAARGLAVPQTWPGFRVMGYPLRTRSEGEVMITSADPSAAPRIRANFLSDPYDRGVMVRLFRIMRRIFADPAVTPFLEQEMSPGPDVQSDDDILEASRRGGTCLHAVGTCKMGSDAMSVVDQQLRVHGLSGLRVMDLSVAPTQISGNTNGPVIAMAWRAADLILKDPDPRHDLAAA
jgi:choline dehydrogenase-like flavoprotein